MAATRLAVLLALGALLGLAAGCNRETTRGEPAVSAPTPTEAEEPALARAARAGAPQPAGDAPPELGARAASADDADDAGDARDPDERALPSKAAKPRRSKDKKSASASRAPASTTAQPVDSDDDGAGPDDDEPAAPAEASLRLKRLAIATGVEGREPVGAAQAFSLDDDDKLYAFVELDNRARAETHVKVTFVPPKGAATTVELKVGDVPRWRTWAKRSVGKARGTWQVVVRDEDGRELGRRSFEVGS